MERYYGLIEVLFSFGAFLAFYIWQMRALKKSVAEREAREAKEKEVAALTAFLDQQRERYRAEPGEAVKLLEIGLAPTSEKPPGELAAWTQVARVILNLQETLTRY